MTAADSAYRRDRSTARLVLCAAALALVLPAAAERVGEVDTVFKLIGPDHKIVIDAYDDPKVHGVT